MIDHDLTHMLRHYRHALQREVEIFNPIQWEARLLPSVGMQKVKTCSHVCHSGRIEIPADDVGIDRCDIRRESMHLG